jgi:uncharacterized Zn finger protein (UPF0148 family)
MPIRVVCACGAKLNAKDELAGRTVKCPKCSEPLKVPAASAATAAAKPSASQAKPAATPAASSAPQTKQASTQQNTAPQKTAQKKPSQPKAETAASKPDDMDSLFDEIGLAALPKSDTTCPKCGAGMKEGAVLCISCGYNTQTGKQLARAADSEAHARREEMHRKQREAAEKDAKLQLGGTNAGGRGSGGGELPLDEEKTMKSLILIATRTEEIFAAMPTDNTLIKAFRLPNTVLIVAQMIVFMMVLPFILYSGIMSRIPAGVIWLVFLVAIIAFNYTVLWTMAAAIAAPAHLVLRSMGKSSLSFTSTMCVVFYTMAPYLVVAMIPFVGFVAPFLWCYWLALAFTGHHGVEKKVGFTAAIVGMIVGTITVSVVVFVAFAALSAALLSMFPAPMPA